MCNTSPYINICQKYIKPKFSCLTVITKDAGHLQEQTDNKDTCAHRPISTVLSPWPVLFICSTSCFPTSTASEANASGHQPIHKYSHMQPQVIRIPYSCNYKATNVHKMYIICSYISGQWSHFQWSHEHHHFSHLFEERIKYWQRFVMVRCRLNLF